MDIPEASNSMRRQALMEELRRLEQMQQARQQQAAQALAGRGGIIHDYLQGQGQGSLLGGSISAGGGGGARERQFLGRSDLGSPRASFNNLASPQAERLMMSSQLHNRMPKSPMLESQLPGGASILENFRKRSASDMWGQVDLKQTQKNKTDYKEDKFSGMEKGSASKTGSYGYGFLLPLMDEQQYKKRRKTSHPSFFSYKLLWSNTRTSSPVRRELFARKLQRGSVAIIIDKPEAEQWSAV
jgi:hypothetical protein